MFSAFLDDVITKSKLKGGCGMSTRPAFYSGRGATVSDLSSEILEKIWKAVEANRGKAAAKAFVKMVADIPVLSATDFLIALNKLESEGWKWRKSMLPTQKGIYADDEGSAIGTVMTVLGNAGREVDQTYYIRDEFLRSHGVTQKGNVYNRYGLPCRSARW